MNRIASLVSGIVFGLGLTISEMINPAKVLGFLDLFGNWDPSLMFVMIGALVVSSPMCHLIKKKEKPIFAEKFNYSNFFYLLSMVTSEQINSSAKSRSDK